MISAARLAELVAVCREHGVRLISDEIYHGLTYERAAQTALAHGDDVVVINSFSKYFSMTGWRVGWMVLPESLVRSVERLSQNLYISPPAIAQAAALGAFDAGEELEANRRVYADNRALLLAELPKAGFTSFAPADGAFYLYCDVGDVTGDATALARSLLRGGGRRGDARDRLRRAAWQPVPAVLLRGNDGRHGRGGAAPPGLGRASAANPSVTGRARPATDCRRPLRSSAQQRRTR